MLFSNISLKAFFNFYFDPYLHQFQNVRVADPSIVLNNVLSETTNNLFGHDYVFDKTKKGAMGIEKVTFH